MSVVETGPDTDIGGKGFRVSFDRLAPIYRAMEWVAAGRRMRHCRTAFLSRVQGCRRALLIGEGPGQFLVELLRTNPQVRVTCVERSSGMIQVARRRLGSGDRGRVEFQCVDALHWSPPPGEFDLVATHFFFDCFQRPEVEALVTTLALGTSARALWLISDFQEPESGWRLQRARVVLAIMYAFFRVATGLPAKWLTPPDEALNRSGFRLVERRTANFGLLRADLWERRPAGPAISACPGIQGRPADPDGSGAGPVRPACR